MNFNKRNLSIVSVLVTIIIFVSVNFILSQLNNMEDKNSSKIVLKTSEINSPNNPNNIVESEMSNGTANEITEVIPNLYKNSSNWRIEIPAINLDAPILEGTSKEIMRKAVGHFEESQTWNGNVCLAAHNRGYKYNYFQEIKRLKVGDYIKYTNEQGTKLYQVVTNNVIDETDWSYIENTKDNRITLITCVENKPKYRQCVQAKEV